MERHHQPTRTAAAEEEGVSQLVSLQRPARNVLHNPIRAYLWFRRARILTVEPVLFLYMFGLFLYLSVGQEYLFNWYGRRMLRNNNFTLPFNFCLSTDFLNDHINLTSGKKPGDVVQSQASLLSLGTTLLGQLPSIFAALVYGPLTDRIGRKPIMVLIGSSGAISGLLFTMAVYFSWPVYWFIPLTLINSLAGGIPGILTIVYSYIADVSSTKWLTLRLGILESMLFLGTTASLGLGGVWLEKTRCNFVVPFVMYCIANILILVYVTFLLPKSLTKSQRKARQTMSGIRHVSRGLKIFFTKNEYSRWRLWCAVGSMFVIYLVATGASEISTLFLLHKPLKWAPGAIGIFQSINQFSYALSIFLFIPLFVYLGVPDPVILIVGVVWGTVFYLLTGFVKYGWQMYTVGVLQGVGSIVVPPIRSTISKAVALEDQGAAFSIMSMFQVLAASVASVVFYFFYPLTLYLGLPAGTTYFLIAAINLIQIPLAILLLVYYKRPGAVFEAQKSFSDRTEVETERGGVTEGDGSEEKSPLLAAIPEGDHKAQVYGTGDIQ